MSEKIKVRTIATGIIRYVTRAGYELAHNKYELLEQDLGEDEIPPVDEVEKKRLEEDAKHAADKEIDLVRKEYEAFIGSPADKRKGIDTLKEEIEEFKNQNS
jgi:hypothetical protein